MALKRSRLSLVVGSNKPRATKGSKGTQEASVTGIRPVDVTPATSPEPVFLRDSYASTAFAEVIDRSTHSAMARFTAGLSPMTLSGAYADWASHLAALPGKRSLLVEKALRKWLRFVNYAAHRAVEHGSRSPSVPVWVCCWDYC